jgi:hypothetical protein
MYSLSIANMFWYYFDITPILKTLALNYTWTQVLSFMYVEFNEISLKSRNYTVAQMIETLCYKPDGSGFETRLGKWTHSIYLIFPQALGSGVYSASNKNEYQKQQQKFLDSRARLTSPLWADCLDNMGFSTSHNLRASTACYKYKK